MVSPVAPTLSSPIRHGLVIQVACQTCGHKGRVEPAMLVPKHDKEANFKRLKYRCACGSTEVKPIAFPRDWKD